MTNFFFSVANLHLSFIISKHLTHFLYENYKKTEKNEKKLSNGFSALHQNFSIPFSNPPHLHLNSNLRAKMLTSIILSTAVINLHILRINNLCDMGIVCYELFYL